MSRAKVYCLVEGFSEANLVERILAPHLSNRGVDLFAPIVKTRRDRKLGRVFKGGGDTVEHYLNDLSRLHRQWQGHENIWLTSMVDVYGLPGDFPKLEEAHRKTSHRDKVEFLKATLLDIASKRGITRFIPYLSLHEFETLLFADLDALRTLFVDKGPEIELLKQDVWDIGDIEEINHTMEGAPSKRIGRRIPAYEKYKSSDQSGAITVLEKIGLPKLRQSCQHFDQWVCSLEQLGAN